MFFDVLRQITFNQIGGQVSHIKAVVFIDVADDVHRSHLKRKHAFGTTQCGCYRRLFVQNATDGQIRKALPGFIGEGNTTVGQKVGLPFSRDPFDVGLSFNKNPLVFQSCNGPRYIRASDGNRIGDAHLRQGKRNLNAVLEVGIIQQMEQDTLLHAGFCLCGHTSTLGHTHG